MFTDYSYDINYNLWLFWIVDKNLGHSIIDENNTVVNISDVKEPQNS